MRLLAIGRLGPDMSVGRAGYGVGQVVLETALDVMLHELRHEASDGTGETPMLQELRHEAVIVPVPPVMLEEVVHEASEGTGETPVLQELMHEGSDGTGETPELWEIVHEAIVPEDGRLGGATLEEVRHEAAQGVPGTADTPDRVRSQGTAQALCRAVSRSPPPASLPRAGRSMTIAEDYASSGDAGAGRRSMQRVRRRQRELGREGGEQGEGDRAGREAPRLRRHGRGRFHLHPRAPGLRGIPRWPGSCGR